MSETARKPKIKVGDIVLADGSWWQVGEKQGQRITARLLANGQPHRFTSRSVSRVFRELGRSSC